MEVEEIVYDITDGDRAIEALKKEYEKRHPKERINYWKMKNGKKIKIEDITDEHILNAIKVISNYEDYIFFDQNWD